MSAKNVRFSLRTALVAGAALTSVTLAAVALRRMVRARSGSSRTAPCSSENHQSSPVVPPATDTQVKPVSPPAVEDTPERRQALELYDTLKADGNKEFSRGNWEAALGRYQDAVDVLSMLSGDDTEAARLSQVVRANVILVFLKLERYDQARMLATFLLQDDEPPVPVDLKCKVLFRRAMAMVKLGDLEGALGDLKAAQHFSPKPDAAIEEELAKVQRLLSSKPVA